MDLLSEKKQIYSKLLFGNDDLRRRYKDAVLIADFTDFADKSCKKHLRESVSSVQSVAAFLLPQP
jgi:hypothetical protein